MEPSGEGEEAPAGPALPMEREGGYELDCYPYTFSPLLVFADGYFDKGFSNYNSVAQFFEPVGAQPAAQGGAAQDSDGRRGRGRGGLRGEWQSSRFAERPVGLLI